MNSPLTQREYLRYSRHLVLPEIGIEGQCKLKQSSVLIVGAGGLGSPIAMYLAAAGIGRLGLVDYDRVEESNLQRQIIHDTRSVGKRKVVSALRRLRQVNPLIRLDVFDTVFSSGNAREISRDYQILVDGTDNLPTRYLLNDLAVLTKKAFVYGSVFRFEGQVSVFDASKGPCYRCLFPAPPDPDLVPSCQTGGVLGVLPGIVGSIEALQVIKYITGIGEALIGKLLLIDGLDLEFRTISFGKVKQCPICGQKPSLTELIDYEEFCGSVVRSTDTGKAERIGHSMKPRQLNNIIQGAQRFYLLDVRNPMELRISHIPGAVNVQVPQVQDYVSSFRKEDLIIVFCRTGIRSAKVCQTLRDKGFTNVWNLAGGINRWVSEFGDKMNRY